MKNKWMSEAAPAGKAPDDKLKERSGYCSLTAKDYRDKGEWDILISDGEIRRSRGRGVQLAKEFGIIVPEVLANPTAIFKGIRWDADEDKVGDIPSWLCYVGLPLCAFDAAGHEIDPYEDKVYLVFVNSERVVYHYRWDKCCPDNPRLPAGHNDPRRPRFRERVL